MYQVELDKVRTFEFGMIAFDRIEKKLKKTIAAIDCLKLTVSEQAIFAWAGLVHEDKDLTPEKVMQLIDKKYSEVMDVMWEAVFDALGVKDTDEEEPENPNQATAEEQ